MMKHLGCILCGFGLLMSVTTTAFAWDGRWTDAKSGTDYLYDKEDSTGKAGSDPPQHFLIPPPRDYVNVDAEELDDYFKTRKKDYAPYALLRLTQAVQYEGIVIPKGYYHVKVGDWADGSPANKLNPPDPASGTPTSASISNPKNKPVPMQRVLVIKRLGNVIAVVPIHAIAFYKPPRKDKIPKRALAWLEQEERRPVLKFYEHAWVFSTYLQ